MSIKISPCTNSEYNKLSRSITRFNDSHFPVSPSNNMMPLGFVVKESMWSLIGGITGTLLFGKCLSIDILWVADKYRKQGIGSQLLITLEDAARKNGAHLSQVDTFDFQALGFYQKIGYKIFGILDDCPHLGNKRYYLKKKL